MARVLIVDDVYTIRLKTELVLRHAGCYLVQSVNSGAEAIEAALANPPDIIILDIVMAGMDGFATLRAMRAHGITCPVVAYTSRRERKEHEFEVRGFDAYVPKAESLSSLLTVLRILLNTNADNQNVSTLRRSHLPALPTGIVAPVMISQRRHDISVVTG